MVSSDVQQKWKSNQKDKENEFQFCSTAEKCGSVALTIIGFF